MEDIIKQVLDFIQTTGSILIKSGFELTVRQVIGEAIIQMILCTVISLFIYSLFIRAKKYKEKYDRAKIIYHKRVDLTEEEDELSDWYSNEDRDKPDFVAVIYYLAPFLSLALF